MRYRAPEEFFEFVDMNIPFDDEEALEEYTKMFREFLYCRNYEIGDEIEFPDLNGNIIIMIKEFPRKNQ